MSHSCATHDHNHDFVFTGKSAWFRRILIIVTLVNFTLFLVEVVGGHLTGSLALQADSLDFLADTITYSLSLWAIQQTASWRARAAQLKGLSLVLMALFIIGSTLYRIVYLQIPQAEPMGMIALAAFAANAISVLLLARWRQGDANIRSVWLCSRNDAIGNLAVIAAAALTAWLNSGWPDVAVAAIMATLFLSSAWQILQAAKKELQTDAPTDHTH